MKDIKCSWCKNTAVVFLMHQGFCAECAKKFRKLHEQVTIKEVS